MRRFVPFALALVLVSGPLAARAADAILMMLGLVPLL